MADGGRKKDGYHEAEGVLQKRRSIFPQQVTFDGIDGIHGIQDENRQLPRAATHSMPLWLRGHLYASHHITSV